MTQLNALSEQIERLEADEALRLVTIYAVGGGNLKKADSDQLVRQWQRDSQTQRAQRPRPGALLDAARELGIEVVNG